MSDNEYGSEIIDVAYRAASDEELFQTRTAAQQAAQDEAALQELRQDVMRDPERCFCRNCGKPVFREATVCVHCNYVMNPAGLQTGSQLVRARREKYERGHRVRSFITNLTGIDLETPEQKAKWAIRKQDYHYQTSGAVYCTNCGCEVDPGASVCVRCNYVLNPLAVQRAKMAVRDRTAKVTKKELLKSLLIPGHGFKLFRKFRERRPQVANPCRIAGLVNSAMMIGAMGLCIFLIIFS